MYAIANQKKTLGRLLSSAHLQAVQKVSARLKKTFLSAGSAIPPAQLFREFRGSIFFLIKIDGLNIPHSGRDPTPEALLISLGLKDSLKPRSRAATN